MRHLSIPTTFLFTLIAGGCSSVQPQQGNPFDEPVMGSAPRAPAQVSPRPSLAVPASTTPSRSTPIAWQAAPESSTIKVFPAGAIPSQISTVPTIEVQPNPAPIAGTEALAEAEKVAGTGDTQAMIELLDQSAFQGNMDALYKLARVYQNGVGVPANPELAVAYLTTASGLGHVESTRVLAWDYLLGKGVSKDIPYGTSLMEKAAETSTRAKREFGLLLNNTYQPNLNDPARGQQLLQEAAAAGDVEASRALVAGPPGASPTAHGGSTKSNAAPMGDPADMKAEALKSRAMAGDLDAMYRYALGLSLGKFPSIDGKFEAYCWYAVAAGHGHTNSKLEVVALAGVRTLSDRKSPGKLDQCIRETTELVEQGRSQGMATAAVPGV